MNDKFAPFTEEARKVLSLAQEESQRFNHNYIGTEHLLLGLVREGDGTAAKVLAELGVELNKVRSAVEFIIGRGDRSVLGEIGLTPRAKKVISLAVDESQRLEHHYIGTEHLLLGLIREGEGIAAGVLESQGVRLEAARTATLRVLDAPGGTVESREASALTSSGATPLGGTSALFAPEEAWRMNDKFDRFTERARKVLSLAQEEAQRFNHNYIGTEHLLLGLVREGDGVAAKVLANLGVEVNKVRSAVEFMVGRGDRIILGEIGLTPRAKKVVELAVDEARRLNHHYIGTEHLLLGLIREGEGIAAGVLVSLGVNLEQTRTQTIQVLSQGGAPHAAASSSFSGTRRPGAFTFAPLTSAQAASTQFNGVNEDAQHVLSLAQIEAHHLHQDYLGDEHILLGLVLEGRSYAAQALAQHGATILAVRRALDGVTGSPLNQAGTTPIAREILGRAQVESAQRGAPDVTPEHLLLGLLRRPARRSRRCDSSASIRTRSTPRLRRACAAMGEQTSLTSNRNRPRQHVRLIRLDGMYRAAHARDDTSSGSASP